VQAFKCNHYHCHFYGGTKSYQPNDGYQVKHSVKFERPDFKHEIHAIKTYRQSTGNHLSDTAEQELWAEACKVPKHERNAKMDLLRTKRLAETVETLPEHKETLIANVRMILQHKRKFAYSLQQLYPQCNMSIEEDEDPAAAAWKVWPEEAGGIHGYVKFRI
jgi:hypothetical protein